MTTFHLKLLPYVLFFYLLLLTNKLLNTDFANWNKAIFGEKLKWEIKMRKVALAEVLILLKLKCYI